ncbi:MAG TPA: phosphoribosylformylglycinamidine synthase, partial [Pirellulales bacterium]|nr:phosphoribosylformylglycinamidine synthase [Pirellulales bacterium]
MLWEIDIYPAPGQPDLVGTQVAQEARDLGVEGSIRVAAARGYLVQGSLDRAQVERLTRELLADAVVERYVIGVPGEATLSAPPAEFSEVVHVLPKPGVTDPVAQSALAAIHDLDIPADAVRT